MKLNKSLKRVALDIERGEVVFEYETCDSNLYSEFQSLVEKTHETQNIPFSDEMFADLFLSLTMRQSFITSISDLTVVPRHENPWFSPNPVNKACFSVSFNASGRNAILIQAEREG